LTPLRKRVADVNLTINITARDITDATIGVGRVGLNVAQRVSQAPIKVNETKLSTLFSQPLTICNLVVLRLAILVERLITTWSLPSSPSMTVRAHGRPPIRTSCPSATRLVLHAGEHAPFCSHETLI
jgi:hypothetical protein